LGSAAVAIGCNGCRQSEWEFLTGEQARALAAICDQIIPADDFPSASQAGVLTFIDRQLARHFRRYRDAYRDGIARADALSRHRFGRELAALDPPRQFEIISAIEQLDREFFELVRSHTLDGYYGAPRHGGNHEAISWRMLGLAEPPLLGRVPSGPGKGSPS
jgi:gluconate 2-dehydrogenase gamma chain